MIRSRIFLAAFLFNLPAVPAVAQGVHSNVPVVTGLAGSVNALAVHGDRLYLGGSFAFVGPATGGFAVVDTMSGAYLGSPPVLGAPYSIVPDGTGGWYLGGDFSAVAGVPRANLAHILPDGSLDAWNPGTDGIVYSISLSNGVLYVGGTFTMVAGQPRSNVGAIDAATGLATTWNPSADNQVDVVVAANSAVYVGGFFTNIGGQPRNRAAALSASTGLATAWNPDANYEVRAIAIRDTIVYLGGRFSTVGGQSHLCLAAVGMAGGSPTSLAPDVTSDDIHIGAIVSALSVADSILYVGGVFRKVGGVVRYGAAAIGPDGTVTPWATFDPEGVHVIVPIGNTIYLAGTFDGSITQPRNGLEAVDAASGIVSPWNPDPSFYCIAMASAGGRVAIGGYFVTVGQKPRNNLASIDLTTGKLTDWSPNSDYEVFALAVDDSAVYAGGHFHTVGGQARNLVAALDPATGQATAWNPTATGADPYVFALALEGKTLYVGGNFTGIGGLARSYIAAVDATTAAVTAWDPSADGAVYSLATTASTIYAGGQFAHIGGQARDRVAALSPTSGTATAWNPGVTGNAVVTIAEDSGIIYIGGDFSQAGDQIRKGLAAIDANSAHVRDWNPAPSAPSVAGINGIFAAGPQVYVTGTFTNIGSQSRSDAAAIDAGTAAALPWSPALDRYGQCVLLVDSTVYVGGAFSSAGLWPQRGLAGFDMSTGGSLPGPRDSVPLGPPVPARLSAVRVMPNPASGPLRIEFALSRPARTTIKVFDLHGREVARLADAVFGAGLNQVDWDPLSPGARVRSGVYFVQVDTGGRAESRRVALVR
jgi:hypothetical protein